MFTFLQEILHGELKMKMIISALCNKGQRRKKDITAACLCFLKNLAYFRPAADRAVSILPWLVKPRLLTRVSLGWFDYSINIRNDNPAMVRKHVKNGPRYL
jgi:hypothetical protein